MKRSFRDDTSAVIGPVALIFLQVLIFSFYGLFYSEEVGEQVAAPNYEKPKADGIAGAFQAFFAGLELIWDFVVFIFDFMVAIVTFSPGGMPGGIRFLLLTPMIAAFAWAGIDALK